MSVPVRALSKWLLCASLALPWAAISAELPPLNSVLSGMHHTAWTRRQGAPANIYQIAQDKDGWLWLGTQDGLYRFDGVHFEHMGENATTMAILSTPSGDLWTAMLDGRLIRRRGGTTDVFDFKGETPTGLAVDTKGRILASFVTRLRRLEGGQWHDIAVPQVNRRHDLCALTLDAQGTLWIQDGPDVLAMPGGRTEFAVVARTTPRRFLSALPGGGVLMSEQQGFPRVLHATDVPLPYRPGRDDTLTGRVAVDRDGRIWVSRWPEGLEVHAADSAARFFAGAGVLDRPEVKLVKEGLSGKHPWAFFQDREGTVWVGTNGGLDRFRRAKFNSVSLEDAGQAALAAADDGGVWVGRWNHSWVHVKGARATEYPEEGAKTFPRMNCAHRTADGTVWLCGNHGLRRFRGTQPVLLAYPEQMGPEPTDINGSYIFAIAGDATRLLIAAPRIGFLVLKNQRWTSKWPQGLVKRGGARVALLADGLTCMSSDQRLACGPPAGPWRIFGPADGLDIGDITSLQVKGNRLWMGGPDGVARMEGGRIFPLIRKGQSPALRNVAGVVETRGGELWIHGVQGAARVSREELGRLLAHPEGPPPAVELFDFEDGLDGVPEQRTPTPTAIEALDGTLWFASSTGVYWINPAKVYRNEVAPTVVIRGVSNEGQAFAATSGLQLQPHSKEISISYTALSLANPERVRFQHRLDGFDDRWTDVGQRREAAFTNLPAGDYVFRLRAINEDGVASAVEAVLPFSVQPAFFETWWFRMAGGLAVLAVIGLAVRWRIATVAARLRERLQERLHERERIAREMHDTLLQGLAGLILKFDAGLQRLAPQDEVRTDLALALEQAEEVMVEGRDRMMALRVSDHSGDGLNDALAQTGRRLAAETNDPPVFQVRVAGEHKRLRAVAGEEVLRIGCEALTNAFRHARARRIEVTIAYESQHLVVRIADDGQGIPEEILQAGARGGHWGLPGMRERASEIGARLDLRSSPGTGTTLTLTVRGAVVYSDFSDSATEWRGWRVWTKAVRKARTATAARRTPHGSS